MEEAESRSGGASQAAELALVPVRRKKPKENEVGDVSEQQRSGTQKGRLEIEDIPKAPQGQPEVLGPKNLEPLFNAEQVRKAEELSARAPMLQSQRQSPESTDRKGWDRGAHSGDPAGSKPGMELVNFGQGVGVSPPVAVMPTMTMPVPPPMFSPHMAPAAFPPGYHPMQAWAEDHMRVQVQLQHEMLQMSQNMKSLQEENARLRVQLMEERETKYSTPPDGRSLEKSLRSIDKYAEKRKKGGHHSLKSKEDGSRDRQDLREEDGSRDQQDSRKEDGSRDQQDTVKEEGSRDRQGVREEDGSRDQQEDQKEDGSRDRQDSEVNEVSDGSDEKPGSSDPEDSSEEEVQRRAKVSNKEQPTKEAFDTMLKLMQGMQRMQEQLLHHCGTAAKKVSEGHDDEVLRGGVELHHLPEWSPETAPVDLQDWLLLVDSQMCDISASSHEWWVMTLETARKWYKKHQSLKPIEKLQHQVSLPSELEQAKWKRLERRASNLMLRALPESQREDIIAGKDLSVLAILTKLMVNYQPGGGQEKAAVLSALELPTKKGTIGDAVAGLRRWLRWKKRALDMGLILPDPSVLLRGLDRLVGKVINSNPTLQFRINLTRTEPLS